MGDSEIVNKGWSSTAPPDKFKPYVAPTDSPAELTMKAVLFGALFGIFFGIVTVYLGLRAGLTVSASIPIAVLSISILRMFGRTTILENNIVQTAGSSGESVAAGVLFTLPALIFLGFPLEYWRITLLALIGGCIGVLFMIPLRRSLIVKEHGNLVYPEGTACADVLVAGERGGSFAGKVFAGLGIGGAYAFLVHAMQFWKVTPAFSPKWMPGATIKADVTPEYLGVGYIIGPKIAGTLFAGGVFSWLLMMPAIKFFGSGMVEPLYPGTMPIKDMLSGDLYSAYIRPMGAGAVAAAGLITLVRTIPTIVDSFKAGLKDFQAANSGAVDSRARTEQDMSMKVVLGGSAILIVLVVALLNFYPIPGAEINFISTLVSGLFVVIFGFLFVTVSSRIVGIVGSSSNPVSGMTIATLMATCAVFLMVGWTGGSYAALALSIGGLVCIAAANAGATSQDLKTGYLVGATPIRQQIVEFVGVIAAVFFIGMTLILMNVGLAEYRPTQIAVDIHDLPSGVKIEATGVEHDGKTYTQLNVLGSRTIPEGKYFYSAETEQIEVEWIQGIGSEQAAAPQARLMATIINGILNRQLPWGLVALGVFLVITVELLGVRSLAFAVGSYLSIGTTLAIFCGGFVRWLAERGSESEESEVSPGSLYSSGLIAGGAIFGLGSIAIALMEDRGWLTEGFFQIGPKIYGWFGEIIGPINLGRFGSLDIGILHESNLLAVVLFALLAYSLFHFARQKLT